MLILIGFQLSQDRLPKTRHLDSENKFVICNQKKRFHNCKESYENSL